MKSNSDFKPTDINSIIMSFNDICTTCNNAEICLSHGNKIRPVWFCEQFDDFIPSTTNNSLFLEKQPVNHDVGLNEIGEDSRQYKGLCINCELRETCINCDTESGIWHCEEYQ